MNPEFLIEGTLAVLHPLDRVSVVIDQLGAHVESLAGSGQTIADALDELLTSHGAEKRQNIVLGHF